LLRTGDVEKVIFSVTPLGEGVGHIPNLNSRIVNMEFRRSFLSFKRKGEKGRGATITF
jgi:hypothetical protein